MCIRDRYYLAKKDHTITPNERSMLDLQARSYGITEERRVYLEQWYDGMWEKGGSNNDLARKYGKSGINMMGVFSTTGEAPINEGEILEAFNRMDTNKDDVISKDEFSEAPEVSKLPQESQEELFDTIDLNGTGLFSLMSSESKRRSPNRRFSPSTKNRCTWKPTRWRWRISSSPTTNAKC